MHGYIIQLDTLPIERDNLVDKFDYMDLVEFNDIQHLRGERYEKALMKILHGTFPEGMFDEVEKNGKRYFVYNGGIGEWKKEFVKKIKALTKPLTPENVFDSDILSDLRHQLIAVLGTTKFVVQAWNDFEIFSSTEFMKFVDRSLKPGNKLYIGTILSYQ